MFPLVMANPLKLNASVDFFPGASPGQPGLAKCPSTGLTWLVTLRTPPLFKACMYLLFSWEHKDFLIHIALPAANTLPGVQQLLRKCSWTELPSVEKFLGLLCTPLHGAHPGRSRQSRTPTGSHRNSGYWAAPCDKMKNWSVVQYRW